MLLCFLRFDYGLHIERYPPSSIPDVSCSLLNDTAPTIITMDEKAFVKGELYPDAIPVPVQAAIPTQRRSRLRSHFGSFLKLALATAFVVYVHSRAEVKIQEELGVHEGRWVTRVFSDSWSWHPRKVLYGKKAEKSFL